MIGDFRMSGPRSSEMNAIVASICSSFDSRTAQDVVGHSSINVTMGIYAKFKECSKRAA